ncbi:hypothetical protein RHGRI_037770 [Rhododendron griersonianum]|uniref:Non-haem dioxygenase N-terminal domain-containing protein n=1 Tax=Rhododendron griersonianum TaxID=479676 RepID=A0AAV6HW57_9ERIC|nr:hypothetical protein RHGRI_037770 [Rhododendron griersonianum]
MAKESPTIVPARYIQRDQDPPITSYATSIPDVPIIDMEKLLSGDHMELKKLDSASKEWGFFQLINHGVSSALLEKVKLEISEFFNLPMEEKKKFWQDLGDIEGFGQSNERRILGELDRCNTELPKEEAVDDKNAGESPQLLLKDKNLEYKVLPMNYKAYGVLPVGVKENFQSMVGFVSAVFAAFSIYRLISV